jgi:hypothetical protein
LYGKVYIAKREVRERKRRKERGRGKDVMNCTHCLGILPEKRPSQDVVSQSLPPKL